MGAICFREGSDVSVRNLRKFLRNHLKIYSISFRREWLLTKIVNGERASYSAPKFARMQERTRSQMLEDIVANLANHAETGQIPKPYRRGSWRPIGHMRPSSPLLDSVRDQFEGNKSQLRAEFTAFSSLRPSNTQITINWRRISHAYSWILNRRACRMLISLMWSFWWGSRSRRRALLVFERFWAFVRGCFRYVVQWVWLSTVYWIYIVNKIKITKWICQN